MSARSLPPPSLHPDSSGLSTPKKSLLATENSDFKGVLMGPQSSSVRRKEKPTKQPQTPKPVGGKDVKPNQSLLVSTKGTAPSFHAGHALCSRRSPTAGKSLPSLPPFLLSEEELGTCWHEEAAAGRTYRASPYPYLVCPLLAASSFRSSAKPRREGQVGLGSFLQMSENIHNISLKTPAVAMEKGLSFCTLHSSRE